MKREILINGCGVLETLSEIHVPYEQIIDTMRILFGPDVIITFSSELLTYNNK